MKLGQKRLARKPLKKWNYTNENGCYCTRFLYCDEKPN